MSLTEKQKQYISSTYAKYTASLPSGTQFKYGTAGFRMLAEKLNPVMYTVAFLASLRALQKKASVGVMITASHNGYKDNGVKVVDVNGEVMEFEWEKIAEQLANSLSPEALIQTTEQLLKQHQITADASSKLKVFIGKDTRPSSEPLSNILKEGLAVFSDHIDVVDYGLLSTPQLHYLVKVANDTNSIPNEKVYYEQFCNAYKSLIQPLSPNSALAAPRVLNVDCAYGVGGSKIITAQPYLQGFLDLKLSNIPTGKEEEHALLNESCGAEYVQKEKKIPKGFEGFKTQAPTPIACFDGDADRLVYFYFKEGKLVLVDGDKIAALCALLIADQLKKLNLDSELTVGVVQTAYANGASTAYLKKVFGKEEAVGCEPTGVKYLHHRAKTYDVGIYFEANGHGTVIFSNKAIKTLESKHQQVLEAKNEEQLKASIRMQSVLKLINQQVGDAISDLLFVEAALQVYNMDIEQWNALYTDLPSIQTKLKVKDRTIIKTSYDETQVLKPEGIQDKIVACMKQTKSPEAARAFIRPSGTEDVVRVYAEAATQEDANELAYNVMNIIYTDLQGIEQPQRPSL